MEHQGAARAFLEVHNTLRAIAERLAPVEKEYLAEDGLGSAGMEASGIWEEYNALSKERGDLVEELRRLRMEAGDETILAELKGLEGSEQALDYIHKVPLRELKEAGKELAQERRRGFFGRFR